MIACNRTASSSSMSSLPSGRYIFDVTDMVRFAYIGGPVTGIPRVALTLASQAYRLKPDQVTIGYFDAITRKYRVLADPGLAFDSDELCAHLKRSASFVKPVKFWKYKDSSIKSRYRTFARQLTLRMLRAHSDLFGASNPNREISFDRGDKLICLGSGWDSLELVSHLTSSGVLQKIDEFIVLVHDLIPLLSRALPGVVDARLYRHWLQQILGTDASLLFYSSSSETDACDWLKKQGYLRFSSRRFRLGDELIAAAKDKDEVRKEVQRLSNEPFMLFVGSMNGRKNGLNLLRALRQLHGVSNGRRFPRLVVAGSSTPHDINDLCPDRSDLPDLVFVTKPNDTELAWLYSHCRFTVYPSLYEGWGLPVGESLWHGKICATSNCSSMPEVGGDDCDYFDPHDPTDMARVLQPLIFDEAYLQNKMANINRGRLKSWRESALDLLSVLDAPSNVTQFHEAA